MEFSPRAIQKCPVCGAGAKLRSDHDRPIIDVRCPRCGEFQMDAILRDTEIPPKWIPGIRVYLRRCNEEGRRPEMLPDVGPRLKELADAYAHTGVAQKLDYLLRLLGRRSEFAGQFVRFDFEAEYPAVAATNENEAQYLAWSLQKNGMIEGAIEADSKDGWSVLVGRGLRVTPGGWATLQSSPTLGMSGRCFVAMSFDSSLTSAYEDGIKAAVEKDAGFECVMMLEVAHNEKICDRILSEIRRSQFVVADATGHRHNVYFEAGFATGLNRPVIWTCRADDFNDLKFDTRQYNHIKWAHPDDLRVQLRDRILATIGQRTRM